MRCLNGYLFFFSENVYHLQLQKNQAPLKGHGLKKVWYLSVDIMVLFHLGVLLHL